MENLGKIQERIRLSKERTREAKKEAEELTVKLGIEEARTARLKEKKEAIDRRRAKVRAEMVSSVIWTMFTAIHTFAYVSFCTGRFF